MHQAALLEFGGSGICQNMGGFHDRAANSNLRGLTPLRGATQVQTCSICRDWVLGIPGGNAEIIDEWSFRFFPERRERIALSRPTLQCVGQDGCQVAGKNAKSIKRDPTASSKREIFSDESGGS